MSIFKIDEVLGLSDEDYHTITEKAVQLYRSGMDMSEMVTEFAKGCNAHDVMVGFKMATLVFLNEGMLAPQEELE